MASYELVGLGKPKQILKTRTQNQEIQIGALLTPSNRDCLDAILAVSHNNK